MWPEYVCQDLRDRAGVPGHRQLCPHGKHRPLGLCSYSYCRYAPQPHLLQACSLTWSLPVSWDQGVQGFSHIKSVSSGHLRTSSGLRAAAVDTAGALGQERRRLAWPPRKRVQTRWGVCDTLVLQPMGHTHMLCLGAGNIHAATSFLEGLMEVKSVSP